MYNQYYNQSSINPYLYFNHYNPYHFQSQNQFITQFEYSSIHLNQPYKPKIQNQFRQSPQKVDEYKSTPLKYEQKKKNKQNLIGNIQIKPRLGTRKRKTNQSDSDDEQYQIQKIKIRRQGVLKKRIRQTPNRNVVTNMCSKLINFITNKKKSKLLIEKIYPQWRQYEIKSFYSYCNRLRNNIGSYTNLQKFGNIWLFQENFNVYSQFHRLIRILSKYYLNELYVLVILNSKRIKKQARSSHLKAKIQFLRKLQYRI